MDDTNSNSPERTAVFEPQKKLLVDHFNIQTEKAELNPSIPNGLLARCKGIFDDNINDITSKSVDCLFDGDPMHHRYIDERLAMFMIVTTLPWTTEESVLYLKDQSMEPEFGYFSMFATLFLNNWPAANLTHYLHIILSLGGGRFRLHTAIGDYGGSPTAPRDFSLLPFDLLTDKEKKISDASEC